MSEPRVNEIMKLENQLCFPLYAAARQVTALYTPYLKELGLTYTQYIVFLVLWENDGIPVGELGRRLYLDNGTLTPLLKKLESSGYLTRSRDTADERVVTVALTDEGRALQSKAAHIPEAIGSCIHLSEQEARDLYRILYQLLKGEQ
ncbi:MarR family transcriptional regulator [uncultured Ruminococcus sp.]|uniref:MarR family winged helix-turn-helix transcriptional regulator n=1 Tax=uncultured Ruminococcus sp. TaxID=165186 RepID=UPI00292D25A9|nr:MarR family transcriptional regulator [uncultured Ruminococcus sp.]